jgi:phosphoribosylformylglycinamidine (FGAM) synthase PurS component
MRNYDKGLGGDSVQPVNKWKVCVEMTIEAPTSDDAWEMVKEFIQNAIINEIEVNENEVLYDFDVRDVEPAELDIE